MNWRFFGDSSLKTQTEKSVLNRFTKTQMIGNQHIKTIFDIKCFKEFNECHSIKTKPEYKIMSTDGRIIHGPFNKEPNLDVIQLNHYKSKTFEEFEKRIKRGRADINRNIISNLKAILNECNKNEIEDLWAYNLWNRIKNN